MMPLFPAPKSLKTALAVSRGLGSAKNGTGHWRMQRVTAMALLPLGLWFIWHVLPHVSSDHAALVMFLRSPCECVFMILLIVLGLYHTQLGLQVIVEDYIHHEYLKIATLLSLKALGIIGGLWGILSVLIIQFKTF